MRTLVEHRRVVDHEHGIPASNEPIFLNKQFSPWMTANLIWESKIARYTQKSAKVVLASRSICTPV
jgi:hypothetical protein